MFLRSARGDTTLYKGARNAEARLSLTGIKNTSYGNLNHKECHLECGAGDGLLPRAGPVLHVVAVQPDSVYEPRHSY
jgi:hypothetical protein